MYLKPLVLRDWSKGTWRGMQNSVAPVESVRLALNMDSDSKLGSLVVRKGLTKIGYQTVGKACYGLHYFIDEVAYAGSRSPSISPSLSPSISPSVSLSLSPSISPSFSPSISPSASPSLSPSLSPSISPSLSPTSSNSLSPSISPSASISPSVSPSLSASFSVSPSLSPSEWDSDVLLLEDGWKLLLEDGGALLLESGLGSSKSPSLSPSLSPSISPSFSPSGSKSPSSSLSPSASPSASPSVSPSQAVEHRLFAVLSDGSNNDIYDVFTGQKSLEDDTKNRRTRFLTYLDSCLRINGVDAAKAWDGSDWITTAGTFDLANIPANVNLAIEWKDRVYVAGVASAPDKLFYSGIANEAARTVSWTVDNGYIMIEQEDGGGGITALAKCPGYLLIFKRRSLKRWDGSSTFPDDMVRQGTPTQECVCYSRGMVVWLNEEGIWATVGGMPKQLSDLRVDDFIKAISDFNNVQSQATENNIFFFIGTVTVDNITYPNVMLKYNIDYQNWDIRSYSSQIMAMAQYVDSEEKLQIIAGDDDGNVGQFETGNDDFGTAISWTVETQDYEFSSRAKKKDITQMIVHTNGVKTGTVFYRKDSLAEKDFQPLASIQEAVTSIRKPIDGRWFNFKVADSSTNGQAEFLGFEFPEKSIKVLDNV